MGALSARLDRNMVKSVSLPLPRARAGLWTLVALLLLLGVGLAMRLVNLDLYTGKFDEGIRAEQLLLMSAGFRPVRDVFAAQGPLSLDLFYGPYLAFGQTLAAARAAVVLYSLLGLLAVFWVGGLVAGRLGGVLAVALLVLSPLYLKNSRLALLEVPALVPATLALGSALLFQASGRRRWLLLSAVTLGLALSIKPMVIGVLVPIGLALLLRPNRRFADFLVFGGALVAVVATVVALYGPREVWEQVVVYRQKAGLDSDWTLRGNWKIMLEELRDEQLPIYALAIIGGLYLAISRRRWGIPLAAWPLVNLGLLLVYSPLQFKHVVTLLPPIALLIGAAAATAWRSGRPAGDPRSALEASPTLPRSRSPTFPAVSRLVLLTLGGWYLTSIPALARQDWQVMSGATETRAETYTEESRLLAELTTGGDFVIVDDPIVAFNAGRMVPPSLVDTSSYRVRSGTLSGTEVVEAAEQRDVKLLLLSSDGLRDVKKVAQYVDERYRAIKIWERPNAKDRALYLRDDANFELARTLLTRDLDRAFRVELGGDVRLLGYNLGRDEVRPGSSSSLTLHLEAIRPMAVDYHLITHLRGPGGQPSFQSERGLGGGGEGTASWEAERWVFRSHVLAVPPRATPGDYEVAVALYDSKARTSPTVTAGEGVGATEVVLGPIRVR